MTSPKLKRKFRFLRRLIFFGGGVALFVGLLVAGFYFINDPEIPRIYIILIALGLLGLLLYFFLKGGGGKGGPLGGYIPPGPPAGVNKKAPRRKARGF